MSWSLSISYLRTKAKLEFGEGTNQAQWAHPRKTRLPGGTRRCTWCPASLRGNVSSRSSWGCCLGRRVASDLRARVKETEHHKRSNHRIRIESFPKRELPCSLRHDVMWPHAQPETKYQPTFHVMQLSPNHLSIYVQRAHSVMLRPNASTIIKPMLLRGKIPPERASGPQTVNRNTIPIRWNHRLRIPIPHRTVCMLMCTQMAANTPSVAKSTRRHFWQEYRHLAGGDPGPEAAGEKIIGDEGRHRPSHLVVG